MHLESYHYDLPKKEILMFLAINTKKGSKTFNLKFIISPKKME